MFLNKYKSFTAAYQLKSDGSPTGNGRNDDCITVNEFLNQPTLKDHNNDLIKNNQEVNSNQYPSITIPYLTTISPGYHLKKNKNEGHNKFSTHLYNELKKYNLYGYSPQYLESQTYDGKDCSSHLAREMRFNNDTYEKEYTLIKNINGNEEQTTLFVYIGKIFTGSFLHKHGSACAYSIGGKRLWMLYNKTGMKLLNNKNLPKYIPHKCPRMDARCIEGLHPIDIFQHYEELVDLQLEPYIHVQNDGDVFCFPEGWFHGTLNLDNNDLTLTISLVLSEQEELAEGDDDYVWEGEDFD